MFVKPDPLAEFEGNVKTFMPTEQELRMVTNRNKECLYYWIGLSNCRKEVIMHTKNDRQDREKYGFLPCKSMVDEYYKCLTDNKYGRTLDQAPEKYQADVKGFYQCAFKDV